MGIDEKLVGDGECKGSNTTYNSRSVCLDSEGNQFHCEFQGDEYKGVHMCHNYQQVPTDIRIINTRLKEHLYNISLTNYVKGK